jgi:hypothetical protein
MMRQEGMGMNDRVCLGPGLVDAVERRAKGWRGGWRFAWRRRRCRRRKRIHLDLIISSGENTPSAVRPDTNGTFPPHADDGLVAPRPDQLVVLVVITSAHMAALPSPHLSASTEAQFLQASFSLETHRRFQVDSELLYCHSPRSGIQWGTVGQARSEML